MSCSGFRRFFSFICIGYPSCSVQDIESTGPEEPGQEPFPHFMDSDAAALHDAAEAGAW